MNTDLEATARRHGCTTTQLRTLRAIGRQMMAAGRSRMVTPIKAFDAQRINAGVRGIGWELTLWQWWTIWQESGHWDERGSGKGYVMCRKGDVGPYAVGNVVIDLSANNSSLLHRRPTAWHAEARSLKAAGLRQCDIARHFNVSQAWICELLSRDARAA